MAVSWRLCARVSGQLGLLLYVMWIMPSSDLEPQQHWIYRVREHVSGTENGTWPYGTTTGLTTAGNRTVLKVLSQQVP